jgi:Ribosomally synthesized peptide prototyped by Frankia Franean1_4349./Nif11 domain
MSQRSVEILLGKLVTDEEIRQRFRVDPEKVFAAARERGLELSAVEMEALRGLDAGALDQLAAALDPRLQKASLQCPAESSGGRRRPRR